MKIASAGNAETACLQFLFDKGYTIAGQITTEKGLCLTAKKDDNQFSADNAIELLGLVRQR